MTVADYFTQELAAAGVSFTSAANTLAQTAIASVTSAPFSVVLAESTINTWLTSQPSAGEVALIGVSHISLAVDRALYLAADHAVSYRLRVIRSGLGT